MAKAKAKYLTYGDIYRIEDELFQLSLRSYTMGNPAGLDELVSPRLAGKRLKHLLDTLDAFVVNDTNNNVVVKVYIEQYAYNTATQRALVRLGIHTEKPGATKGSVEETDKVIIRSMDCSCEDRKPCALTTFEDITSAMQSAATNTYYRTLSEMGVKVDSVYD